MDGVALTGAGANYLIRASSRVTIDGKPFLDPAGAAAAAASGTAAAPRAADEFSEHGSSVNNTALRVPTHLPRPRVWLYYKPVGLIVSHKDAAAARAGPDHARRTIFEQLDEDYFVTEAARAKRAAAGQQPMTIARLLGVSLLDYLSEGLDVARAARYAWLNTVCLSPSLCRFFSKPCCPPFALVPAAHCPVWTFSRASSRMPPPLLSSAVF
jgi:hypothetical protein